jgi:hypothetical protein
MTHSDGKTLCSQIIRFLSLACLGVVVSSSSAHADPILFAGTRNFYDFIPGSFTWEEARVDATARVHLGVAGHLATLTSFKEDQFIRTTFSAQVDQIAGPWLGADWDGSGFGPTAGWSWVTGEDFAYTGWNEGEPNHLFLAGGDEDALHFSTTELGTIKLPGGWNDIFSRRNDPIGYFVEFERSAIPEPSTLALFGIGTLGMLVYRRRRLSPRKNHATHITAAHRLA